MGAYGEEWADSLVVFSSLNILKTFHQLVGNLYFGLFYLCFLCLVVGLKKKIIAFGELTDVYFSRCTYINFVI